ncbi:ParM/StbA family protein [Paenibacillus luteus]|uniref:ParM/StbA family protein n=1 Tax=Paenibacillus luteus TaxID=2545753 RepID=UPI001141FF6F|nr:ParM/StbA family protein [Paenibacillus luteus]
MVLTVRKGSVDIGNSRIKAIFGDGENVLDMPNVLAAHSEEREIIQGEAPKDALHVKIVSGALNNGNGGAGTYVIGNLAAAQHQNDELTYEDAKSVHDQPVIMLLSAMALDAAMNASLFKDNDGVIEADYFLSTGLPLGEAKKKGTRKAFKEKLKGNSHEVTFLTTPGYENKKIRIKFHDALINTEGHAAMIELTTKTDGSPRNEDLINKMVLIHDIGGLSTDDAIIKPDGTVDNINSDGEKEGLSSYLDEIIRRVDDEFGVRKYFKSRGELIENLTHKDPEEKMHVWINSNRHSFKKIVDEILGRAAKAQYDILKGIWGKVPRIQVAYLIGGGSSILKDYIIKLNENDRKYIIKFEEKPEDSIWMIVRAYHKLLKIYLSANGIQLTAATKE